MKQVPSKNLYVGINLAESDPQTHAQAEGIIFGFWIFLMADLVIFGALFATYAAMSVQGVAQGPTPSELFDLTAAFSETMMLLISSFLFGYVTLEMKYGGNLRRLSTFLILSGVFGALFVAMELHDYWTMFTDFNATPQVSGFLSAYYLLTGTHVLHVSAGLIWMIVILIQLRIMGLCPQVKLRLMRLGLFWHMLDLVWIGIFTFVYLFGAMS